MDVTCEGMWILQGTASDTFVSQMMEFQLIRHLPYAREIMVSVLGKDWDSKLKSGTKHSISFPAGTEFEASLVTETPFNVLALNAPEQKYRFKFHSILCGFMHLGLLMPSLI
jgi:hypothetical protein